MAMAAGTGPLQPEGLRDNTGADVVSGLFQDFRR